MLPTFKQADGKVLRAGYTTGTCAAAAAAAAVRLLYSDNDLTEVEVSTPAGITLVLPLAQAERQEGWACAAVKKDAGDDPDVTHNVLVVARAKALPVGDVEICGGEGVGRVTKPGLALQVGEAAINPGPRAQILAAVKSVLPPDKGVSITIEVPGGKELAQRTLNPQLGIVGGISILGTTGIVEPMSSDAFRRSLSPQIDVALAAGCRRLVLTPGKMGKKNALKSLPVAEDAVVVTSNFIGYMLRACAAKNVEEVLLYGHIGKLVKVAAGIAETHSAVADARRETLVAHAALLKLPHGVLTDLMQHNTAEESAAYLLEYRYVNVLQAVAEAAARRAEIMVKEKLRVGCIMLNLAGDELARDSLAARWLEG
ncbi:cobalt-precorrin-5B (C(1))-methyltransferase CbiD [Dethiobacter alkaliphilus]|uniref:cobalt-precorrin-5B (C(1))-methyltransferase CbiD n=1 Tax=Dethiobacter alkaliphilus TaxID=427926 RepID=UPI0022267159|nr:cobalt-precorrin-5B (C(1))-methyltransferase CbiD [Dethiobacter alkaliphilus]MCW3491475.1 cobalt-precorrin-5B (C(1))-methyltransferase CbiD [Dethiobacter alkaliphilus]